MKIRTIALATVFALSGTFALAQAGGATAGGSPAAGGSAATATVIPAIAKATDQAVQSLLKVAALTSGSPFEKIDPKNLK